MGKSLLHRSSVLTFQGKPSRSDVEIIMRSMINTKYFLSIVGSSPNA